MLTLAIYCVLLLLVFKVLNKTALYSRNVSNVFLMMPKENSDYFQNGLDFVMGTQCVSSNVRTENSEEVYRKCMLGKITRNMDIH